MKLKDISTLSKEEASLLFHLIKRRKNNPKQSKSSRMKSFIDMFGGMSGYNAPGGSGSVSPDTR